MTTVTLSQQALDDLITRLKVEIRIIVQQELRDALQNQPSHQEPSTARPPLDLPILNVGPWPEALGSLGREELYGDDGR